jgi:UDP:flavonoid glycosyltransferase YjiC (YdhE family)
MKKYIFFCLYSFTCLWARTITFSGRYQWNTHNVALIEASEKYKNAHPEDTVQFLYIKQDASISTPILKKTTQNNGIVEFELTIQNHNQAINQKIINILIDQNCMIDSALVIYDHCCEYAKQIAQFLHIPTVRCNASFSNPKKDMFNISETFPLFLQAYYKNVSHDLYYSVKTCPLKTQQQFDTPIIPQNKKIIYVAWGSFIGHTESEKQKSIYQIYRWLIQEFAEHEEYVFIIPNVKNKNENFPIIPSNFYMYEHMLPQIQILEQASLFITHGGINSVNESIITEVPTIVIPFVHDQVRSAENISNLHLGISFLQDSKNSTTRQSLDATSLKKAIIEIINNSEFYKENIRKIKEIKPQSFAEIIENILQKLNR